MKVRDLMSTDVITLHADSQMVDAEELMGFRNLRHLPVVDGKKKLVGLVTHRVLLRHYLSTLEGKTWMEHQIQKGSVVVRKIMHDKVRTIGPDEALKEAARIMHETKFGCLPVIDKDGKLVGIITEADFVHLAQVLLEHTPDPKIRKLLQKG
jgi:CBS domain-containing protein